MKKKTKKLLIISAVVLAVIIAAVVAFAIYINGEAVADEISIEEAQQIIDDSTSAMFANNNRKSAKYIAENTEISVKELEYGLSKNIIVYCSVKTVDTKNTIKDNLSDLLNISTVDSNGIQMPSTKIKLAIDGTLLGLLEKATLIETDVTLEIYQTDSGYVLYTPDETIDTLYGGLASVIEEVNGLDTIVINGEEVKTETNLKRGLTECVSILYEDSKPDTSVPIIRKFNEIKNEFYRNFIEDARWHYVTDGLWVTAKLTFFAVIIGIVLGFLCAIIRCTHDKIGKLKILNAIVKLYLTVIRGTPVLVQLMIIFFVIFMPLGIDKVLAAILCFGLNSGAYVAEIVRGGIMSVDHGQFEAGRSLGFGYVKTMWYIVLPQAFKSVLPALANEFIVLLKETSVASYIGINDLTRGGDIIRGITFSAFMPLIVVALVYLVLVVGLSYLVSLLERRLRKSDRG